jgi:hypothetical protein
MTGFYTLGGGSGKGFVPARAARLEVEWWRVHRELQHDAARDPAELGEAVAALYAYTYDTPIEGVRESGELRADAMRICDRWVASGCDLNDPMVNDMRRSLLRSYRSLKAAVT